MVTAGIYQAPPYHQSVCIVLAGGRVLEKMMAAPITGCMCHAVGKSCGSERPAIHTLYYLFVDDASSI